MAYKTKKLEAFFTESLKDRDPVVFGSIKDELKRQQDQIELIASENIVSKAVMEAQGGVMTNKYAEGYPSRRYYGGCEYVDIAEAAAIERACKLFDCTFANVQPHSGASANAAVMMALAKPGDTILGLDLSCGGHLTHGSPVAMSGKWFNAVQYGVDPKTHQIDFNVVHALAKKHKPKVIIAGGSAYPRIIDFKTFRKIADEVGAYLFVDMAHFAGLVAAGLHPNPLDHCHVATTTTHKTLRGPRGGMILSRDADLGKKFNSAIFPGMQGGPLMHVIAAKAVAFGEALRPEFKQYSQQVLKNCQALSKTLIDQGFDIVSGGTDTHLILVDLRPKKVTGNITEKSLDHARITCNKNGVPNDPEKPMVTSGIRLGTPAGTTRGFKEKEFRQIGKWIAEVIEGLAASPDDNSKVEKKVAREVKAMCKEFPIYRGR